MRTMPTLLNIGSIGGIGNGSNILNVFGNTVAAAVGNILAALGL